MTSPANTSSVGKKRLVAGYVLTVLVALFLTFDTVIKVLKLAPAVQGTTKLGYPASAVLWDRPDRARLSHSVSGATHIGLGRAIADRISGRRDCDPRAPRQSTVEPHALPIDVALLLWGGLYLRETRLRELVPFRR